jgi:hypothetical protein
MNQCRQKIIDAGLGESGLAIQARMGEDPGHNYFMDLTRDLKQLFDELQGDTFLDRELTHALFCLGHYVESEYSSWITIGKMRENLLDDILRLETAIESIFCDMWLSFDLLTPMD